MRSPADATTSVGVVEELEDGSGTTNGTYHGGHNDYQPEFFFFAPHVLPKITGTSRKTPEFRKMAIMISLSELISFFFSTNGDKH